MTSAQEVNAMKYEELYGYVKEAVFRSMSCGVKVTKVVLSDRFEKECRERHKALTGEEIIKTFFGIPVEFANLPDYLNFYTESEVLP